MKKTIKISLWGLLSVFVLALAGAYFVLNGSLATLTGKKQVTGVKGEIALVRDQQGIPTITAKTRADVAFGLGYLHGQERFFQMDLLRKSAAGEINQLVGDFAENYDKFNRVHRFRARAEAAYRALPKSEQALLQAYANGVNTGLNQLTVKPFEYFLLNKEPLAWLPEESFLAVFAMYIDLQFEHGLYERTLAIMEQELPADWFAFLKPQAVADSHQHWEAPIAGEHINNLAIPTTPWSQVVTTKLPKLAQQNTPEDVLVGSNNWGVNGQLTPYQSGMVAVDMHLGIRVPNIWYRASWYLPTDNRRVTGATLPGAPIMIVGSNEHISWGFTNSYGDWSDVVQLKTSEDRRQYLTPQGWQNFTLIDENVGNSLLQVKETIWGPVIGTDPQGNELALRWVAHDVQGANLNLMQLEQADTVAEALAIAPGTGMPAQNLMVADKHGELAWGIIGAIPDRLPMASNYLNDWSQDDSQNWQKYLDKALYPKVHANEQQRLWTANSRVVADHRFTAIGDGGYDIGIRAGAIKKRLFEQQSFNEQALLDIQLDTKNYVFDRWHKFLTEFLTNLPQQSPMHKALLKLLADYDGHAEINSTSYAIISHFRKQVISLTLKPVYQMLEEEAHKLPSPIYNGQGNRIL